MIETWQLSKEHQAKFQAAPEAEDAILAGKVENIKRRDRQARQIRAGEGGWTSPVPLDDSLTNVKLVLLHEQIAQIYRWWADEAPGVTPQETGHLADLWAHVDQLEESQ